MSLEEIAFEKAKVVLEKCSTRHGMYASGGRNGYDMVFSRDSMIGLIGTSTVDWEKHFKKQFKTTLETFAKNQRNKRSKPCP